MFYTVLIRSNWYRDPWKLYATYDNEKDAKYVSYAIRSPRPSHRTNHTKVVTHTSNTYESEED